MNERQALRAQLHGTNSHLHLLHALEGLSPRLAGKRLDGAPHTLFQVLQHMIYWQDITLARLRHEQPERPASSELGWQSPEAPEDASDLEGAIACFAEGLRAFEQLLQDEGFDLDGVADRERGTTAREELLMIQGHNSYHLGQIVTLRQRLGAWPPPRGGSSW
jgi:uncharacterized damage-inducible protein DinB